ncbi:hypothetical protein EVJ58_g2196 [Rhodofomes roseus]|uniref:Uncharacterized protein n=1 Tax=Rhodofomes roseus TaxID=34475 RepID=A0A4Y9YU71_9APHY|nr:hypothetical protein EVJ58_g2196 [Rhodofomes roseus]
MVDWTNASEIALDSDVYGKLVFALFGVYVWEVFQTSGFEWSLITRTRKLKWPLSKTLRPEYINCQALYTFNSWAGNMAILGASTSLMLRTIAIWERKMKIVIPLCFLCLCHWVLLWRGMFLLNAQYSSAEGECVLVSSNHVFLNVTFFMTMGFDLTILVFTVTALVRHKARSDLWSLLFTDGLVYFLTAFCFNALPAILNVLNLNVAMDVVATRPSPRSPRAAPSSACRTSRTPTSTSTARRTLSRAAGATTPPPPTRAARRFTSRRGDIGFARPEVHVTTDQFVVEDYRMKPLSPASDRTKVKLERSDTFDLDGLSVEEDKATYPMAEAV